MQHKKGLIAGVVLWLMVWSGYNTGIERVLAQGFPASPVDLLHGLRAFIPLLAGMVAFGFLVYRRHIFNKQFFLSPLGLLLAYGMVGIGSSLLSPYGLPALYWAMMFISVVLVAWALTVQFEAEEILVSVLWLNWMIAGVLSVVLTAFFFLHPGAISSLKANILICMQRPFESLATVQAGVDFFGMAGTRPTGLARYAGVAALAFFIPFLYAKGKKKAAWGTVFSLFFLILFFSKGKAGLLAFVIALGCLLWIYNRFKTWQTGWLVVAMALSAVIVFYNIPCLNTFLPAPKQTAPPTEMPANPPIASPGIPPEKPVVASPVVAVSTPPVEDPLRRNISTLSGRGDIWREGIVLFATSPIVGYGFQADRYFLQGQHAHNTLIHALIQTGLVGTVFLVTSLILSVCGLYGLVYAREGLDRMIIMQIAGVFIFLMVRGTLESFAFYSADLLFLVPIIAYIQVLGLNTKTS